MDNNEMIERRKGIRKSIQRPVVLVGMMGAGKTYTGRLLANALGMQFFDTDAVVEERAGMSIAEIFETYGEEKFRNAEFNAVKDMLKQKYAVISVGGGAMSQPGTQELIIQNALTIWLNPDFELLWARVSTNDKRPLLQTDNPRQTLKDLVDKRRSDYQKCDIEIKINANSSQNILDDVIQALEKYLK